MIWKGSDLVNCAAKSSNYEVEDASFLEEAASKYSPELVKSLLLNRIEHKIGQIKVVSESVGINEKQENLCKVMTKSFEALKSDIELMDETQVICGDDTYERTIKSFISQFAILTETFNHEYDYLRVPDITNNTSSAIIEGIKSSKLPLVSVVSKLTDGVGAFRDDIQNFTKSENGQIRVLANSVDRPLATVLVDIKAVTYEAQATPIVERYGEIVSMFYRQLQIITTQPEIPTTPLPVDITTQLSVEWNFPFIF